MRLPTKRIFRLRTIGLIGCKINYFKDLALLTCAALALNVFVMHLLVEKNVAVRV